MGRDVNALTRQFDANPPNPLLMLPVDWILPVSKLWATNAHLLPSPLAICARLKLYEGDGLETADVERITAALMKPTRAAQHKFAADLLADLSQLVADVFAARERLKPKPYLDW